MTRSAVSETLHGKLSQFARGGKPIFGAARRPFFTDAQQDTAVSRVNFRPPTGSTYSTLGTADTVVHIYAKSPGIGTAQPQSPKTQTEERVSVSNVTQQELDAKLEAIEARAEARLARFEERIAVAIESMHEDRVELKDRIGKMEESSRRGNEATLKAIQQDNKQTRGTTIVTALTSVVAIVGGIAAFNATVLSNMLASFESGRNTATSIVQATEQIRQTQDRLDKLSKDLEQRALMPPASKAEAPGGAKP